MNLRDAIQKARQIVDEERVEPTVSYEMTPTSLAILSPAAIFTSLTERSKRPRRVRENPEEFQLKSGNFDLLCALLDQVPEQDRPPLFASLRSRISDAGSYLHKYEQPAAAGCWACSSSELPLLAEFLVRRGDKQLFIRALSQATPSPGLTLLLNQLEEMIALNFTLFTDEEYAQLPTAIANVGQTIADLAKLPKSSSTIESNTILDVCREVPEFCHSISEACRKARYLYVKGSLWPGMNLEVNQDKSRVRTFLEKLGFPQLLIESLDEAERLYRTAATPFELKAQHGTSAEFFGAVAFAGVRSSP